MKKNRKTLIFIFIVIIGLFIINKFGKGFFSDSQIIDTEKINLPKGYICSTALKGLTNPSSFEIDKDNNIYVSENINEKGRIVKYTKNGKFEVLVDNLNAPISQIMLHKNTMYISHRGKISKIENGFLQDIITALPSFGDYSNNGISIGYDGMIYICQGSATNSGVVGMDNFERKWLHKNPYFHDYPPKDIVLRGANFKCKNMLTSELEDRASTGAFKAFGSVSDSDEVIKGRLPGNSCIMRFYPDGINLDLFAWGIRNPINIVFTPDNKAYMTVRGMENRGSRPIANGRDYIYEVKKAMWFGWPDYEGGEPVTLQKFKPKNSGVQQFLTNLHPTTQLPKPLISFEECGRIGIMAMCRNSDFGYRGQLFVPLLSGTKQDAKISVVDTKNGKAMDFITNSKDSKFIENPVQCSFSQDGKLYLLEGSKGVLLRIDKDTKEDTNILPNYVPTQYLISMIIAVFAIYIIFTIRRKTKA